MSKILVETDEYFELKEKLNKLSEINKSLKEKYVQLQKRAAVDVGFSIESFDKIKDENVSLKKDITLFKQENSILKKENYNNLLNINKLTTELNSKNEKIEELVKKENEMIEEFESAKHSVRANLLDKHKYNRIVSEKVTITDKDSYYYLNNINKNVINDDTLLVSMTSYPARIHNVFNVFISILNQTASINTYQCFLTLSEKEFQEKERNLPKDLQKLINNGWVKLIWIANNTLSHKKLMPILEKYPNNNILIVDDDILRNKEFISVFQKDHKNYPNDIICGMFAWYFDKDLKYHRFNSYKRAKAGGMNSIPGIVLNLARPSNGDGGVLYPAHTFTDPRFFDETSYMKFSPTSDESWQFLFNIIENRTLRQTSVIFDTSVNFIQGTQQMSTALHKINKPKYQSLHEVFCDIFPEYKENLMQRQNNSFYVDNVQYNKKLIEDTCELENKYKVIVSLTSYPERFKYVPMVVSSILCNSMKPYKICLCVYQDDEPYLTEEIKELIQNNTIELITAEENLRPHCKYYYTMKKYKEHPIITIDDDLLYDLNTIKSLYDSYIKYPTCISARRVHKIMYNDGLALGYGKWIREYTQETKPKKCLFATGVGGVLYPPNILNIDELKIDDIKKCLLADDILLKWREDRLRVLTVWVKNSNLNGTKIKEASGMSTALYKINCNQNKNSEYLKIFKLYE